MTGAAETKAITNCEEMGMTSLTGSQRDIDPVKCKQGGNEGVPTSGNGLVVQKPLVWGTRSRVLDTVCFTH